MIEEHFGIFYISFVNTALLSSLAKTKAFDGGYNMSGKWIADNLSDAETWLTLPQMKGKTRIISVALPNVVNEAYYSTKLDGVGPAHYFESDVLSSSHITVKVVK
ncbi:hypothetical protein B5M42_017185 [Paenibacillus athensensis]|uniref:Uncharacterized protein n=1 Tax=Paenibacillus athensensis TaxID=1967502 RepID=A0A4Y8PSF9_9BACL|nr:hypothetical protein [Paenibacillus athensensis]MCD1260538.1 hypothetical protein [Paenibacillus athensensis]